MTLDALEFLRRFLLPVLPKGFVRIRYYGFLAHRHRREQLARARELLAVPVAQPANKTASADSAQQHLCPLCRQGRMLLVETFEPLRPAAVLFFDTSERHACESTATGRSTLPRWRRTQAASDSALDDLPEHGYGRRKTFQSLPAGTAARFNKLYRKRRRFSLISLLARSPAPRVLPIQPSAFPTPIRETVELAQTRGG